MPVSPAVPAPSSGAASATSATAARLQSLATRFAHVRARSVAIAAPVSPEDAMVQSMADASPTKWHLAHTTWFLERFVLGADPSYRALHPDWDVLFNSYYVSVGPRHARPLRGLLSRPSLAEVLDWRAAVDARVAAWLASGDADAARLDVLELGLQHEQQHQELLLTDIKHAFRMHPLAPAYRDDLVRDDDGRSASTLRWLAREETIASIGAAAWPASAAFAYDNESPRHRTLVAAHALAHRPVTNAEYAEFIDGGGYRDAAVWLSAGWDTVQRESWTRPLYWDDDGREFTLGGWRTRAATAPVCHLSFFEADAFARWAGARLPTEAEWELAAGAVPVAGNFADDDRLHPSAAHDAGDGAVQLFGDVWEWTSSAYGAYPGYAPWDGALGEYNGKFMEAQRVLRGGSCATPTGHVRASYRNFFPSDARWQFAGLRLAKDLA